MPRPTVRVKDSDHAHQADLEEELRQAEQDLASGAFVEITIEQLDQAVAAGRWPWPDESSA